MADVSGPLYWNPGAISYLVELLLAAMLSAYFAKRLFDEYRHGGVFTPTLLLGVTIWLLVPGLFVSLLHALAGGGWTSYLMPWFSPRSGLMLAMPWVTIFTGLAAVAFLQFAYRFPGPLPGSKLESIVVGIAMTAGVGAEAVSAVATNLAMLDNREWSRPEWLAGWTSASMLWAAVVFLRQFIHAQGGWAGLRGLARQLFGPAANREATAARGFVIFTILPITHTIALVLQQGGTLAGFSMDFLISWSVLAQLTGLTLVYFGYLPERSSFLFKLTAISVLLLLASVNGVCWIIGPTYADQFRAATAPITGQAVRYSPAVDGGYTLTAIPFAPDTVAGETTQKNGTKVHMPFDFPFYGKTYRSIHVGMDGTVGLDRPPRPADALIRYGMQPTIYPLLTGEDDAGGHTNVTTRISDDRVIITRQDRCREGPAGCYALQSILHADGRIDFVYLQIPPQPGFILFEPLDGPWLSGIAPGPESGQPALVRDQYRAFLTHLDRLYAPVVPFTIAMMLAIILGIPLLFRGFLVRPLERLLRGIRRFRDGELEMQVAVTFNDEIGYLTESFNEMARNQDAMMQNLEKRVAERVAEIAEITIRNAQLEERNRLSADLHDAVAQTLASASLIANSLPTQLRGMPEENVKTAELVSNLTAHALSEMRLLLKELRSEPEGDWSLTDRLTELVRSFANLHALDIDWRHTGEAGFPTKVHAMMYRVAQEAINNAVKHSGATRVEITLECGADSALLTVSDNGRGFDPESVDRRERLGLAIMGDRSRQIGAELTIDSSPGKGCRVTLAWSRKRDPSLA